MRVKCLFATVASDWCVITEKLASIVGKLTTVDFSPAPQNFFLAMKIPHAPAVQTPFDSVENAQVYIQLLIETLVEAKKEVADDVAAAGTRSERRLEALRLVEYKLHRLERHLQMSGRMLNDLRRLRRLLLDDVSDISLPPAA